MTFAEENQKRIYMKGYGKIWIIPLAALLCACSNGNDTAQPVRSVYVTQPVKISNERVKSYPGIVKAAEEINLGFKTAGQIEKILVKEGDFVHKGQLLAELDSADYRLAVEALQIQYDQLRDEVERTAQLFSRKSVSANDFEKASAGLRQLGVQLQANKNKLEYTRLYAPADGYIQSVNFSPAEMVNAGTALFTLLDCSRMEVTANIPAEDYKKRGNFLSYHCRATGIEKDFSLEPLSFTPRADNNQLYRMELVFTENPGNEITAGANAEVKITMREDGTANGYTLPLNALFKEGEKRCVWVIGPDTTVSKRIVETENELYGGAAVVTEGLHGDEIIVSAGVNVLQEGEKVKVIARPSKSNIGGLL